MNAWASALVSCTEIIGPLVGVDGSGCIAGSTDGSDVRSQRQLAVDDNSEMT